MKGFRTKIGIFGRMNAGKSSLINALTNQDIAIVSDVPGTTTDPVSKSMELLPLGPVTLVDTAGLDDVSELGMKRVERALDVLKDVDLALLVIDATRLDKGLEFEEKVIRKAKELGIPVIGVVNKIDLREVSDEDVTELMKRYDIPFVKVSAKTKEGLITLKREIVLRAPAEQEVPLVADLCKGGEAILYIFPKDIKSPKGKLPLVWVRAFRETIDQDAYCVIAREDNVKETLDYLDRKISLTVVDTKAFENAYIPDAPLTSFSVIEARCKGDLTTFIKGVRVINALNKGDRILIVQCCEDRNNPDDLWIDFIANELKKRGCMVEFGDINDYSDHKLIIHCNACKLRRDEMLKRIEFVRERGGSITTIGLSACYLKYYLSKFLDPFPLERMVLDGIEVGDIPYEFLGRNKVCPVNAWKY
ncbi:MAG: [FeFe] hydrogenase H-cluster maturation GTPase HydF [Archaeoglobus sp.]|nr:MAG: [FeFe] hydrogenase H-cluster maturation GTPase HydF [Archaeoglobus sp.]